MPVQTILREVNHDMLMFDVGNHIAAMVGFDCSFTRRGHNLAAFAVGAYGYDCSGDRGDGTYFITFSERDFGMRRDDDRDPMRIEAWYWDINELCPGTGSFEVFSVCGKGRGKEEIFLSIPEIPADHMVILRGFDIRIDEGSGHHIRAVGVRYDRESSAFRATFHDDSPQDDAFKADVHYIVVPCKDMPSDENSPEFKGPFTYETEFRGSTEKTMKDKEAVRFLSGFKYEFTEEDHHIRHIGVDLRDQKKMKLTFSDDHRSRVKATIDYVELASRTSG